MGNKLIPQRSNKKIKLELDKYVNTDTGELLASELSNKDFAVKVTEEGNYIVITSDDYVVIVDNPGGTPITKKILKSNFDIDSRATFDTRADAIANTIPSTTDVIRLMGYTSAGDGGESVYKRIAGPASNAWNFQSADGAYWELVPDSNGVDVRQLGVIGDGITDDSSAFQNAIDFADQVFIPFTVGGGLRTVEDIKEILRAGADKVSINTSAVNNPDLIKTGAKTFGSQCIVTAIDAKRVYVQSPKEAKNNIVIKVKDKYCWWEVYIHGGRTPTGRDAILWGEQTTNLGSGEILLTSMDCDGTKAGYDLELTRTFSERLDVPIIASGGAGNPQHIIDSFKIGKADAALAASIFHYNEYPIKVVKEECKKAGIPMRL